MASLLEALERLYPDCSRTTLRQWLRAGRVRVNGEPEREAKRPIAARDRVEVDSRRSGDPRVRIVHEDADLIVVDKAAGLLSVPSSNEADDTVLTLLERRLGRLHVVQRLDRAASGLLVFAKNYDMRGRLQALFATHAVERVYEAIVHGRLAPAQGTLRSFLLEDDSLRMRSVAAGRGGKEAITHYRTLACGARYSRVEATLETGRRNQIRVQMAEAGHPLVGDTRYAAGRESPLGRLGLHACTLGFRHPRTKRHMRFDSAPPEPFSRLDL